MLTASVLTVEEEHHRGRRPDYRVRDGDSNPVALARALPKVEVATVLRGLGLRKGTASALRIVDPDEAVLFTVAFPGWRGRAVMVVLDGEGRELGRAVKAKGFLRPTYGLWHGRQRVGAVEVVDRRQRRARVTDTSGDEVAGIRTEAGGGYSIGIPAPLAEPLRSLVVATAVVLQAAIGSQGEVGETDVLRMSFIPPFLDPLRRGYS